MKFLVASLLEVGVVWYIYFIEGAQNYAFDDSHLQSLVEVELTATRGGFDFFFDVRVWII